ncbi:MAG: hypothetical protein QOE58_1892 [Actinomycetota bacterium]|nr:hypothetical protein [Actinomycetota bacterium]
MARMRKLTTARSLFGAVAALVLITGCAATRTVPATPASTAFNPTGPPIGLTQVEGAKGEKVSLGDDLEAVMPAGSKSEPLDTDQQGITYWMSDKSFLRVIWGSPENASALALSWDEEISMKADPAISNYKRSIVKWQGAKSAVAATWALTVDQADGSPFTVDRLAIWVETPEGAVTIAMATAVDGKLDGSTALNALRTLTVG